MSNIVPVTTEARNFAVRETARELAEASISENTLTVRRSKTDLEEDAFPK